MGIFKCNFLSLQLSYAEFICLSAFGLLFSTKKSDSRATHLTAVYIFFPSTETNYFFVINKYFDLTFSCFFSCSLSLPSFFHFFLLDADSFMKQRNKLFSAFVYARILAVSIGAALSVIPLLKR